MSDLISRKDALGEIAKRISAHGETNYTLPAVEIFEVLNGLHGYRIAGIGPVPEGMEERITTLEKQVRGLLNVDEVCPQCKGSRVVECEYFINGSSVSNYKVKVPCPSCASLSIMTDTGHTNA